MKLTPESARDWPEDFEHENGNYMNTCTTCANTFMGYKRRVTCKVCATSAGTNKETKS